MAKRAVADLSGDELDCWVAKAEGYKIGHLDGREDTLVIGHNGVVAHFIRGGTALECLRYGFYSPSSNWAQGGPIIARAGIQTSPRDAEYDSWVADKAWVNKWGHSSFRQHGKTLLEAAMRCYVASTLGEFVTDDYINPRFSKYQAPPQETSATVIELDREDAWL